MANTPEGRVKKRLKDLFKAMKERGLPIYYHMAVQNGMGKPSLDFTGCVRGKYFAIEAKAPGKEPTKRQEDTIKEMRDAGATVLVFDGTNYEELKQWLGKLFS